MMAVYFARADTTDLVKIGYATNVRRRRALLQAGCPYPLTIARVIEGGLQVERWLHHRFAEQLVAREWFRWSCDMLSVAPPSEIEITPKGFAQLFVRLGGAAAVARFAGLKPGTVQQMKARDSVQPRYWPALIAMARQAKVAGVTHDTLIQLASRPSKQRVAA